MTTVYYNFPQILLGNGVDCSKEIVLGENRNTNIKVNDVNYTAYSVYVVGKDSDSKSPEYFVALCYSDVNDRSSKCVYVVLPIAQTNSKDNSDVDNIIQGANNTSFELNQYIKNDEKCFITSLTEPYITITLRTSVIPIKQVVGKEFYSKSNLSEININRGNNTNAVVKKKDMDWIMTCDLLTEDGPTVNEESESSSYATTITMFIMTIIIAVFGYIASPIIYNELGLYNLATELLDNNHYTITIFWLITLTLIAFLSLVQGITTNTPIFLFMSLALELTYFASVRGVLKLEGVGKKTSGLQEIWFESTKDPFRIYQTILFAPNNTLIGKIIIRLIFFGLIILFIGMVTSMGLKNIVGFSTRAFLFILLSFIQLTSIYYFRTT